MKKRLLTERKVTKYTREALGDPMAHLKDLIQKPILTDRDKDMILAIYRHRCLTSHQLTEMFFADGKMRNPNTICQRRLRQLFDNHIVDRFFVELGKGQGSSPQHVTLDRIGAYIVAGLLNCTLEDLHWSEEYNEVRLPYLAHMVEINDLYLELRRHAIKSGHKIPLYLVEAMVYTRFSYRGNVVTFNPDAYGLYQTEDEDIHFFVELDRGTMSFSQFQTKVPRYAAYYASKEYLKRYPVYPAILVVCPDEKRAEDLQKAVRQVDRTDMTWLFTTKEKAAEILLL